MKCFQWTHSTSLFYPQDKIFYADKGGELKEKQNKNDGV